MPGLSQMRQNSGQSENSGSKFRYLSKEDVEGLLVNLGVVAALILSFVIGLFFTITRDEIVQYTFVDELMTREGFRFFVADRLDNELGEFKAVYGRSSGLCTDCDQCTGYGVCGNVFNVSAVLREIYDEKCIAFETGGTFSGDKVGSFTQTSECRRFFSAGRVLVSSPDFPYEHLLVVYYGDRSLDGEKVLSIPAFLSSTFLSTALLVSLVVYCSLVLSYGKGSGNGDSEERSSRAYDRWLGLFFPLLGILYFLLFVGIVFAYWGLVRVVRIRMVFQDNHMLMYINLAVIFPLLFGGLFLYTIGATSYIFLTSGRTSPGEALSGEEPAASDPRNVLPAPIEEQYPTQIQDLHAGHQQHVAYPVYSVQEPYNQPMYLQPGPQAPQPSPYSYGVG